jgi:hypothetical protein
MKKNLRSTLRELRSEWEKPPEVRLCHSTINYENWNMVTLILFTVFNHTLGRDYVFLVQCGIEAANA